MVHDVSGEPLTVLLVEASDAFAVDVEARLDGALGPPGVELPVHDLVRATTLADALAVLDGGQPVDAVVLDLDLPDTAGLDAVRAVTEADVPVVVLTAEDDTGLAREALQLGAQDVIVKADGSAAGIRRAVVHARERHLLSAELRAARDARDRAVRHLRDFTAMASHELLGPLTAVAGIARILRDSPDTDPAEAHRLLSLVIHRSMAVATVARQLLDIAQAQAADDIETTGSTTTVDDLVADVIDLTDPPLDVRGRTDVSVAIDPHHGHAILRNLLANAQKHGAPPFEMVVEADGRQVQITLSDHGPGIPDELRPVLFHPFQRASRRDTEGYGLGAHLAYLLARANGGSLDLLDGGAGATFLLTIPRA